MWVKKVCSGGRGGVGKQQPMFIGTEPHVSSSGVACGHCRLWFAAYCTCIWNLRPHAYLKIGEGESENIHFLSCSTTPARGLLSSPSPLSA